MLPLINRLKKEKEIKRVFVNKKSCRFGLLTCRAVANNLTVARFCFVVSKRVSNKAVVRNKLKRRLRAAVAIFLADIKTGVDCVLIASSGLEAKKYQELVIIVQRLLAAAGVIK